MQREFQFPLTKDYLKSLTFESKGFVVQSFINEIICAFGVIVSQQYDQTRNRMIFDLNTDTKSYFHIVSNPLSVCDKSAQQEFRYNKVKPLNSDTNLFNILENVRDCMLGRDFIDQQWLKTLKYYDIL
jgi:hypothetical protein